METFETLLNGSVLWLKTSAEAVSAILVPGLFIANMVDEQGPSMPIAPALPPPPGSSAAVPPAHNGTAYWIKVSAQRDGSFTVTNARNGFSKTYTRGR